MRDSGQCRNYEDELLPESTRSLKIVQHIIMYAQSQNFLRVWTVSVVDPYFRRAIRNHKKEKLMSTLKSCGPLLEGRGHSQLRRECSK
jgi:hypothetical protein